MANINYIAVLVAAVANMAIGAWWYSPKGFGKQWMKAMKIKKKDMRKLQKGAKKAMSLSFIGALVMAYVLAIFLRFTQTTTILAAANIALWLWLGFVVTTQFNNVLFEQKPRKAFQIGAGYYLVSLVVMAAILAVWV